MHYTRQGMSREIRDIHGGALCEKYGNNIAEAKQNSPLHMKYARSPLPLLPPPPPSLAPSTSFLTSHPTSTLASSLAFTPFLLLKHLIRTARPILKRTLDSKSTLTEYKCLSHKKMRASSRISGKNSNANEIYTLFWAGQNFRVEET